MDGMRISTSATEGGAMPRKDRPALLVVRDHQTSLGDDERGAEGRPEEAAFLELLSHELRTPVTSIHVAASILRRRSRLLGEDLRTELVEDISEEVERLHRVIDDLLTLAHLDAGLDLAHEPLLLQRVVPQVLQQERQRHPGLTIDLRQAGVLPVVCGDELAVRQVTRDLVSGVRRPHDGERLQVELSAPDERGACLRVLRTGEHVRAAGSDIGRYTCERLTSAMGGRWWQGPRPDGSLEQGVWLPTFAQMTDD